MKRIALGLLLVIGVSPIAKAQVGDALVGTAAVVKEQGISDEELFRTAIQTLSADEFGGRKPLSVHETPVLSYIEEKFKEVGLEPANGNSYFQKVPMLSVRTHIKNNQIVVKGAKGSAVLRYWDETVVWSLRGEKSLKLSKADFVFVGFGINAPEYGWNDYEDVNVKGKIVVTLVNDPGYYDDNLFRGKNMTYYGRWTYKFEEASRQGAAGAIIIHETAPASYDWSVIQNSHSDASLSLYSENGNKDWIALQGWVTGDAAQKLFATAGISIDESLAVAKKKGFKSFPLGLKSSIEITNDVLIAESANVAGVLPGTTLKDEYIIYSAHWDHLGIGAPIDNDSIYNGADDNASGVAALIVIANRFKQLQQRPKRSILFLSVTGEESGLLGSEYYSKHPLFPLDKTVVNLNMDGYGNKGRTRDIILGASGDSETDAYVVEAAATQGRVVRPSVNQTSGGYYRSDHFNFAKVGIPVVLAKGGRNYLNPTAEEEKKVKYGNKSTYHQPSDEYHSWWDVSGSLDDIYLLYGIGLRLANDGYFPKWNDGVVYKEVREGKRK
ncbi:Bacterial leucyl aminopeptidase [termite gut metagenome]|uniref:Bacterial leucyl aminopeptidase n=1 Tax=termite gut metagenome TaxID=433724 RepID=A0A5J4QFB6_9ZZZZ